MTQEKCTFTSEMDHCPAGIEIETQQSRMDGESPFYGFFQCQDKAPDIEKTARFSPASLEFSKVVEEVGQSGDFEVSQGGRSLIPEENNKFESNNFSLSFKPVMGEFQGGCKYSNTMETFNAGCKVQGKALDLHLEAKTPVGRLEHSLIIGGMDASASVRFQPDYDDKNAGFGIKANAQFDILKTSYEYNSPVFCWDKTGVEVKLGTSASWGWDVGYDWDRSLTEFKLPIKGLSLPAPWMTSLRADSYASLIQTPNHPQCQTGDEAKEEITAPEKLDNTDFDSIPNNFQINFFKSPSADTSSSLLKRLDPNYVSPEEKAAALKLTN